MHKKIKHIISSQTFRQSVITSGSTFVAAGLGAVFYIILARLLGAAEYGRFSIAVSVMLASASIADLGMGTSIVRFVGAHRHSADYYPFAKIALTTKLVTSFVFIIAMGLGANFIAKYLLYQPTVADILPTVGLGVSGLVLFAFSTAVLQGLQKYFVWGGLQIVANIARLLFVLIFMWFGWLNATTAIGLFAVTIVLGFFAAWKWIPTKIISSSPETRHWREFWQYNGWTAAFTILASVSGRLDTVLTSRYLSLSMVGVYSLSLTMSSFLPQLTSALGAVYSSKFAGMKKEDIGQYVKKAILFSGGVSVAAGLAMIPAALLVIWFSGKDYTNSFSPFVILVFGIVIFMVTAPMRDAIIYAYKKPQFFVVLALIQGIVIWVAGSVLIPKFQTIGASWTVVAGHVTTTVMVIGYYKYLQKNH